MALITCPDCGKQVSDQATSCIGCGRPLRAAPAKQPTAGSAKATEKGVQRAKWKYDLGNAIGGIGVAIGIVVMIAGSTIGGLVTMLVIGGIGVWLAYFS